MRTAVALSLIDQALLSGFSLALNLVLLAHVPADQFGLFTYALTVLLILTSLQNALIVTPIGVNLPGRPEAVQQETLAALLTADHLLRLALAPAVLALCALTSGDPLFAFAAAAMCLAGLWRETQRGIAFTLMRPHRALFIDALSVGGSILLILALWHLLDPVPALLLGIAGGNAAAVLIAAGGHRLAGIGKALADYRTVWRETRWTLAGAATTEAQYRGYVIMVEALRGGAVLGEVQAGRVLMGPMPLLVSAWGRISRPAMTRALVEGDMDGARRTLFLGTAGVMIMSLVYLGVLAIGWRWIEPLVFHGRYPGIGAMSAAWGVAMLVAMAQMCLGYYLQAARLFRPLAFVSVGAAAVSLVALSGLASSVPPVYAVWAVTAGEAVALVWSIVLVARAPRLLARARATTS
ncbi:lipopolysaccharide biosynthesis protein [Ancylobacter terrae]|uniref:lipopolysaccharide biosynthesis protein n=1 Tax=Ancylobacter sp. sgz301288 TaxID=3342077 RepID=UPI00385D6466